MTAQLKDLEAYMGCGYSQWSAKAVEQLHRRDVVRAPGILGREMEGAECAPLVVSEWLNCAGAFAFYNSPEATDVQRLRKGPAHINVLVGA